MTGPTDAKARKSYQEALSHLQQNNQGLAIWYFRDANKKDHGQCLPCQEQLVKVGLAIHDWKAVEEGATGLTSQVKEPKQQAVAHYYLGLALFNEGASEHRNDLFARAHEELSKAIALYLIVPDMVFEDGKALAQLHRDDEAKAQFQKFVAMTHPGEPERWRAQQFMSKPEIARANLAPDFGIITADGRRVSLQELSGKVVLLHFWATTCETCPRALPHLRAIASKFQNEPFQLLSVSVDYNEQAWRTFLEKNDVPGLQYRDGFNGSLGQAFGIKVNFHSQADNVVAGAWQTSHGVKEDVPKTFIIDADGVLQEQKLSDSTDGILQELITRVSHPEGVK